ncbi:hypothetical protein JW906_12540 [bacterium]|nr:hypothetical protein [bacterium]
MKNPRSILLFALILAGSVFSQNITRISGSHVLIDIDESSGFRVGEKADVMRKTEAGAFMKVADLRVVMYREGKCVGKVLHRGSNPVQLNDFIQKRASRAGLSLIGNRTLSYIAIGTGLAACGFGYYYNDQGDQAYDRYLAAVNPDQYNVAVNHVQTYDRRRNFSYGLGAGLVTAGVINLLIGGSPQPNPAKVAYAAPVRKNGASGVGVIISLNQPPKR